MLLLVIMAIAIGFSFMEYRSLKEQGDYRDITIAASLLGIGILMGCLQLFKVGMPNPMNLIIKLLQPTSQLVSKWLS
jgi:hypothetical protein